MKALDCTQGIQSVAVHGAEQRKLGLFKGLKAVLYIKIKSTNNNKSFKKLHYCHFADAFVQSNLVQGLGHFSIKLTFTQRFKTPVCVISLSDCVCFVVWQSQWKQSKCIGVLKATWLPHGCKGLCGSMCCKCCHLHTSWQRCDHTDSTCINCSCARKANWMLVLCIVLCVYVMCVLYSSSSVLFWF